MNFLLLALALAPHPGNRAAARADRRQAATAKPYHPVGYPEEAKRKNVEGNVVLIGEVSPTGNVKDLTIVATSSSLLNDAAMKNVSQWKFNPALHGDTPVAVDLNVVVQFRRDPGRPGLPRDPGTMSAPILGNLLVCPSDAKGKATAPEGFAVGPKDGGIFAILDLDVPRTAAPAAYDVVVTDVGPGGAKSVVFHQKLSGGDSTKHSVVTARFSRSFLSTADAEQGRHRLVVAVDGKSAGEAAYRVEGRVPSREKHGS